MIGGNELVDRLVDDVDDDDDDVVVVAIDNRDAFLIGMDSDADAGLTFKK